MHYFDAAFQKEVIVKAGYKVNKVNLIELNKDFVKHDDIDPEELLEITDIPKST